ncbi:MAG: hypothetical protein OEV66_06415 [Spirochaetia bacterium]|nr:hypothetical protein [Spirochaetia bacterium]
MAVDAGTKKDYNGKIAEQKKVIAELDKDIAALKKASTQNAKLLPFFHIGIASKILKQIHLYIDMNNLSERLMGVKNNANLDTAKRLFNKLFLEMEKVVTMNVDVSLTHNKEMLDQIKPMNPRLKLNFYKHVEKGIQRLVRAYGENTKWKWSFPELWGKLAIVGKNLLDYREIQGKRDPREEFFYDRQEMLGIVKEALFSASNQYRDKFEISTKSSADLVYAMKLLEDLRKIATMTGDQELGKKCKSGVDSYKARIKADEKDKK